MSRLAFKEAVKPATQREPAFIVDYHELNEFESLLREPMLPDDFAFARKNMMAFKNAMYAMIEQRRQSDEDVLCYHYPFHPVGFYFVGDNSKTVRRADAQKQLHEAINAFIAREENKHE